MAQITGTGTGTGTNTMPKEGEGNKELAGSFNYAINQGKETLRITTLGGAELYAYKQRVG
jgi:hypothetical protein